MEKTYILFMYNNRCLECHELKKVFMYLKKNMKKYTFRRYDCDNLEDLIKLDNRHPEAMELFDFNNMLVPSIYVEYDDQVKEIFVPKNLTMEETGKIFVSQINKFIEKYNKK